MHEVSVALGVLESVESAARAQGIERVNRVHLRIGSMSGIVRDALTFSWDVVSADTICAGSDLQIEVVPLLVFCERCGTERAPRAGSGLLCPECATVASRVVAGRELELVAMEVPE
ncbi:MAG TPA: hydrogenase maturation nickel metallochaperone HypA [Candidatus Tumulicola sp.]|nr:hydrogenase maturation nickel metallochaperone HypA [Candidatus Tumulicola sp.]